MPTRKSIIMLSSTGRELDVVGKPIRADGFFSFTDGLHTVQVTYSNFVGGFSLQGTLAITPQDEDWFDIELTGNCCGGHMINYPKDPRNPTTRGHHGDSGTEAFTFIGNFVWLRAIVSRSHLEPLPKMGTELGQMQKVLLAL